MTHYCILKTTEDGSEYGARFHRSWKWIEEWTTDTNIITIFNYEQQAKKAFKSAILNNWEHQIVPVDIMLWS